MAGDFTRPSDPFACIRNSDDDYKGTILETERERAARELGKQRATELLAKGSDEEWLGI